MKLKRLLNLYSMLIHGAKYAHEKGHDFPPLLVFFWHFPVNKAQKVPRSSELTPRAPARPHKLFWSFILFRIYLEIQNFFLLFMWDNDKSTKDIAIIVFWIDKFMILWSFHVTISYQNDKVKKINCLFCLIFS